MNEMEYAVAVVTWQRGLKIGELRSFAEDFRAGNRDADVVDAWHEYMRRLAIGELKVSERQRGYDERLLASLVA